jgi:hypothetical protein
VYADFSARLGRSGCALPLDRETPRTRRALEQVPIGKDDWKPHVKSMPLGRLAGVVASMPSWIPLIIGQDELELNPPPGAGQYQQPSSSRLVEVHDEHVKRAREERYRVMPFDGEKPVLGVDKVTAILRTTPLALRRAIVFRTPRFARNHLARRPIS